MGATKTNTYNCGLTKNNTNIHICSFYDGYELMQKESACQAQLLCTEVFKKKSCVGTESLHSELHGQTVEPQVLMVSFSLKVSGNVRKPACRTD